MDATPEQPPYDHSNRQSIYDYAIDLRGFTLREKTDVSEIPDIRQNKGSFGSSVERYYFKFDNNSDSAPDFAEAGLELKTTPLKSARDGHLTSKERLVIGMIDYMTVVDETFETSHLMQKAQDVLLISYLWDPNADPLDYRIVLVDIVSMHELPETDLAQIRADWETVVDKVRKGRAHEISGSDTLYLEACTKSANAAKRRKQPFSDIPAKPRAWALKASFMTALSNRLIENMQAIERDGSEGSLPLIELLRKRFEPYFGSTEQELGERFGYLAPGQNDKRTWPKSLCACITRRILGVSDDARIEEFEKAGIKPKSIRIQRNGTPKESVSFPYFDYFELVATPFEESDFASYLGQRYLFAIYREDPAERNVYRLADVALWQMPDADVEEAKRCYDEMRSRVANGHAEDSVKSTENRCCHVRPHDTKTSKPLPTPQGTPMKRKSFWINAQYLKEEIARLSGDDRQSPSVP